MTNDKSIRIAVVGDPLDPACWSGTPYFFQKAGVELGLFNEPLRLNMSEFDTSRKFWNLSQILLGRGKGGYQYSNAFLNKAEAMIAPQFFHDKIVSFNQLFPRAKSVVNSGGKIYYYVDCTLHDLFNEPHYEINIPESVKQKAIALEKENYRLADKVATMGTWTHASLKEIYGLSDNKIAQVLPGPNLPDDLFGAHKRPQNREFTLGFIGKDWERKGLMVVLGIRDELVKLGIPAKVLVVGYCPEHLKGREGLEHSGFIDKKNNLNQFVEVIQQCDLGCLFSSTEALGISVLEFLRFGVPVAGYCHQGMKDTLLDGAAFRFDLSNNVEYMAKKISEAIAINEIEAMGKKALQYAPSLTWGNAVKRWEEILGE